MSDRNWKIMKCDLEEHALIIRNNLMVSHSELAGSCEGAAYELCQRLRANGVDCNMMSGTHKSAHKNAVNGVVGHFWVQTDSYIIDPTREQFGLTDTLVVSVFTDEAHAYFAMEIVEVGPPEPDEFSGIIKGWNAAPATGAHCGAIKEISDNEVIQHVGQGRYVAWQKTGLTGPSFKVDDVVQISADGRVQAPRDQSNDLSM